MLCTAGLTTLHLCACAIKFGKDVRDLLLEFDPTQIQTSGSEAMKTGACLISPQICAGKVNRLDNFEAIIAHPQCSIPDRIEALLTLGAIRVVGLPIVKNQFSGKDDVPDGLDFWRRAAVEGEHYGMPNESETESDLDAGTCSSILCTIHIDPNKLSIKCSGSGYLRLLLKFAK